MRSDFHMHTKFSTDATSEPRLMIEEAIKLGLDRICFTDHYDKDFPDYGDGCNFILDTDRYIAVMKELQEEYRNKIDVRIGVEIGLQPHLGQFYEEYVRKYPFDFVIGSTHLVDGEDPYYEKIFQTQTDENAYQYCFEYILENLKTCACYDVVGHIDYIVRYGRTKAENYSYKKHADAIDEILKYVINHGKGIELNTAGFKYGLGFGHPHPDILKRYKELGGEIITIGSDGHKPEHIAYDFHKVSGILRACGFEKYTEFIERKPIFRQLP